jgi:membrane protease YdiL (CAAX protease family)
MISVSLLVSYLCDVPSNNQLTLTRVQKLLPLTIFVGFLLNASLLEEYFYRQTLWEKLSKPVIQIGVTSMLFALAHHPTSLVSLLVYDCLGLTLGVLRLKTDNLTTMILHGLWNGLVLLLSIL